MRITEKLRAFMATITRSDEMIVWDRNGEYWLENANTNHHDARRLGTVAEVRNAISA
jgi:hypothetical protein